MSGRLCAVRGGWVPRGTEHRQMQGRGGGGIDTHTHTYLVRLLISSPAG